MLFFTPKANKDINVAIDFLCTRVRILGKDDWGKLVRVLRYIIGTLYLPLILWSDSLNIIKCWVGASFASNPYYKGRTGEIMSMGLGSIMKLSRKQKINVRISKEAKIVGADNALKQCLYSR